MKEHENASVKLLETAHVVEVPSDVDFVYIMRKDSRFVAKTLASRITAGSGLSLQVSESAIFSAYERFTDKLADALCVAFSSKGTTEIHLFEAEPLEQEEFTKAGMFPVISLDPLLEAGVASFAVSRGFFQGGITDFGQISRPGSEPLEVQAEKLAQTFGASPVCVIEDDIFSGGSVIAALEHLQKAGVHIEKLIPGFQIGKPTKLKAMGIHVDPVVTYKTADNTDIFNKVDLGDPRDYLIGASGLVVKLSDGTYGRVPYVLPFVSTSARASVPGEAEESFAQSVWDLNAQFFSETEQSLGHPLLLGHMDEYFVRYMQVEHGVTPDTLMSEIVMWAGREVEIEGLHLPKKLVFVDVNGTLIPDDASTGDMDPSMVESFQSAVKKLEEQGVAVGLCSDSPLPQLKMFAQKLGMSGGLVIAENGNIISYNDKSVVLKSLPSPDDLKEKIYRYAASHGYEQVPDVTAVEFGGVRPQYQKGQWGFGIDRQTSIAVFGPSQLIESLKEVVGNIEGGSVDASPQYNFIGVHPGRYTENKGAILREVAKLGHEVTMVGNSMSDWVVPGDGVTCTFVAGSRLSKEIALQVGYQSPLPTIQGVTDILQKLSV